MNKVLFFVKKVANYFDTHTSLSSRVIFMIAINVLTFAFFKFYINYQDNAIDVIPVLIETLRVFGINLALFLAVFYILGLVLPRRIYEIVELIFVVLTILIAVINLFLILQFQTLINPMYGEIFFASNPNEMVEFLSDYLTFGVIVAILVFLAISFALVYKKYFVWNRPSVLKIVLFIAALVAILDPILKGKFFDRFVDKNTILTSIYTLKQNFIDSKEMSQYAIFQENVAKMVESKNGGYITKNDLKIPKIILIIGESTQKNYMSLYGYFLPTTPLLDKRNKNGELLIFNDIISPHATTNNVLSKALTFLNYENQEDNAFYKEMNLIDIMNFAGYKTSWYSNQEKVSIWGNAQNVIAAQATQTHFTTTRSFDTADRFDQSVLNLYDKKHIDSKSMEFIVFHIMGTHGNYINRFPRSFAKFDTKGVGEAYKNIGVILDKKPLHYKTKYINAVAYNDYILDEIIKRFERENAIVIYLSDHGDEVYDTANTSGHNDFAITRGMLEIPFVIYLSPSFKKAYPMVAKHIEKSLDLPFMIDDFIHAFLDLTGIETTDFVANRSIFSSDYNKNRKRIVSGGKDYDKELKNQTQKEN